MLGQKGFSLSGITTPNLASVFSTVVYCFGVIQSHLTQTTRFLQNIKSLGKNVSSDIPDRSCPTHFQHPLRVFEFRNQSIFDGQIVHRFCILPNPLPGPPYSIIIITSYLIPQCISFHCFEWLASVQR